MKSGIVLNVVVLLLIVTFPSTFAAEPSPADQMAAAVESWRNGDLNVAQEQLTQMIEAGTRDARAYYYRALISQKLGIDADLDLKAAAKLEAETTSTRLINRALENVQGPTRENIEKYRADARAQLKADPKAEADKALYREGMELHRLGDSVAALAKFDEVIQSGSDDPRVYYFRGVMLAELGRTDEAKLAFADGLTREVTLKDVQLVNLALADVQGGIRQMIEEQTTVIVNGEVVSRQSAQRMIRRLASMSQDERLAEADAAAARKADQEKAAAEARQQKAAAAIIAENKARMQADERLSAPTTPATDLLAAADVPKRADIPAATPKTEAAPLAEVPDASVSTNPFLGGKAELPGSASRADTGPIDTSYLPASADFVFYVRPADILASGFIAPLKNTPEFEMGMAEMALQAGFDVNDIESVTSGVSNFIGGIMQVGLMAAGGQDPTVLAQNLFSGGNAVSILRTNKDIELTSIIAASKGVEASFDGETYYLIESPQPNQPKVALYSVDSRTYVIGVEKSIQNAITNGPGEATNEQFNFVSNGPFVLAFSSSLLPGMSGSIPEAPEGSPPFVEQIFDAVRGKIGGAAIVVDLNANLDLRIVVNLTESEAAAEVKAPLDEAAGMAKQMYSLAGAGSVPLPLQALAGQLVNSLAASQSETVVTIAVKVPGQIVTVIKDNPELFQGMGPMGPMGLDGPPDFSPPPRTLQPPPQN